MAKVDDLIKKFGKVIREPWAKGLSGQEKVWFLVFDPTELRRVEFKLGEFEILAQQTGKKWLLISLSKMFTTWMANHAYKEAYFEDPEFISDALQGDFKKYVFKELDKAVSENNEENSLIVLKDVSSIYGFIKLSEVINTLSNKIKGRMMVLFPGEFNNSQYRLMDARDGWDYLARPITI